MTGCRGGAAQEPYDGVVVTTRGLSAQPIAAPEVNEAEPMASEVDVPWSIALLSDAEPPRVEHAARVMIVDRALVAHEATGDEDPADLQLAVDHVADEKPSTAKSCAGVVKGRS
jgi:hypothetical protein